MSRPIVVAAPAKINLFLHVGGRRADGYHDLQSVVAFTACGDEVSLELDGGFSLSLSGPFGMQLPDSEDNLAIKAAKLLGDRSGTGLGARIALRKNLPVASGVGGGSADAAAVLRGLVSLWQLDPDPKTLLEIAQSLGADVPVCVASRTSWMAGKGELLRPLPPLPTAGVLLVNPGVQISTAQVFSTLGTRRGVGMTPPDSRFADIDSLVRFLRDTNNDLEAPARVMVPVMGNVLREINDLPEAMFARMSGSGATCFALFLDGDRARAAARLLRGRHPEWWICDTNFVDIPYVSRDSG